CAVDALAEAAGMDLHDGAGAPAECRERLPKRPAGAAVTPQHVVVPVGQHPAGEEVRPAGGEAVEAVARVVAREARGTIAPRQEPPRHHADPRPALEETQDEVVVLRPRSLAISPVRDEDVAPDREGGMGDRTLDEGLARHVARRAHREEPALVAPEALAQAAA